MEEGGCWVCVEDTTAGAIDEGALAGTSMATLLNVDDPPTLGAGGTTYRKWEWQRAGTKLLVYTLYECT